MDKGVWNKLSCRYRWHKSLPFSADKFPLADMHTGIVECKGQDQRVHDCDAHPADWDAGSIHLSRSVPLLHVLGTHVDPDVPANWCMGRSEKDICYNKILCIYNGRKCIDADCHNISLFYALQRNGRIHI